MHRSGTSALTGMLARLGVTMPRTLMPADDHNPLGYWESSVFCDFHDRLLASAGTSWDSWSRVEMNAIDTATLDGYAQEFDSILVREFGEAPLFAVKDPRICRLVPCWEHWLARAGVTAAPLHVWRDPADVARSLAARDRLVTEHALLLWLRHMLDAERATRGRPRVFVRYDEVLADWRTLARRTTETLGLAWPCCLEAVTCEIDSFLQSTLRHHGPASSRLDVSRQLTRWIEETLAAYAALARAEDHAATASLDAITDDFERVAADCGAAFNGERQRQQRQLLRMHSQIDDIRRHREYLEGELAAMQAELSAALQACAAERTGLRERIEHEEAKNRELTNVRDLLQAKSEHLSAEVTGLRTRMGELSSLQTTLHTTLNEQSRRAELAEHEVEALRHSLSWRCTAPFRRLVDLVTPRR
jgi:hypothetical protein